MGLCALMGMAVACSPQFEDLFDKSASERLQESMDEAERILTAAEKGWAMGYFPNTSSRGYMLFAKFYSDGSVTLTDYNNGGLTSTSTYSMNTSQGPVLNFDTYSDVLMNYTDPGTWRGGSTGNSGDFEFVLFRIAEDEIVLKGKRYEAKVMMRKITGDGDEATLWNAYYNECEAMLNVLFYSSVDPVLTVDGEYYYSLKNPTSRMFEAYPYGSTNDEEMTTLPYITFVDGIELSYDLEFDGRSVRSFSYDATAMELVSVDYPEIRIVGPEVYTHLTTTSSYYVGGSGNMSGTFSTIFQTISDGIQTAFSGAQNLASIGFSTMSDGSFAFVMRTANVTARYAIPVVIENDQLVVGTFDTANPTMDSNGQVFYNNVPEIAQVLPLLAGTYRLTNNTGLSISSISVVSVSDSNTWITVERS